MKQFIRYTILCVGYILGSQSLLYAETPTDSIDTIPTDSIIAKKDTTVKKLNIFQKVLKYFDDSNAPRPDKNSISVSSEGLTILPRQSWE